MVLDELPLYSQAMLAWLAADDQDENNCCKGNPKSLVRKQNFPKC